MDRDQNDIFSSDDNDMNQPVPIFMRQTIEFYEKISTRTNKGIMLTIIIVFVCFMLFLGLLVLLEKFVG